MYTCIFATESAGSFACFCLSTRHKQLFFGAVITASFVLSFW
jgi:hypothetical protein